MVFPVFFPLLDSGHFTESLEYGRFLMDFWVVIYVCKRMRALRFLRYAYQWWHSQDL